MSQPSYDPTDLRGQQEDKRDAEARKRLAREREVADFKWLMSSSRGRRIVWRLLGLTSVDRPSFDTNAMRMAFNEGNRNLGLHLLNEVMALVPELYPVMMKEQKDERDSDGNGTKSN